MTRIKRRLLINCGPPNASKQGQTAPLLRTVDPFFTPPSALGAGPSRAPALVIKMLIMVIVIRTSVITVVMMTIAHAMIITNMIRGFRVLTILITVPKH